MKTPIVNIFITVDTENSIGGSFNDTKLKPVGNEKTIFAKREDKYFGIPLIYPSVPISSGGSATRPPFSAWRPNSKKPGPGRTAGRWFRPERKRTIVNWLTG